MKCCDYCGRKNIFCINPEELKQYFFPIVNLYTRVDDFMPMEIVKEMEDGSSIWELLCDDLEYILTHIDFLRTLSNELSQPVHPQKGSLEYLPSQYLSEYIKSLGYQGI